MVKSPSRPARRSQDLNVAEDKSEIQEGEGKLSAVLELTKPNREILATAWGRNPAEHRHDRGSVGSDDDFDQGSARCFCFVQEGHRRDHQALHLRKPTAGEGIAMSGRWARTTAFAVITTMNVQSSCADQATCRAPLQLPDCSPKQSCDLLIDRRECRRCVVSIPFGGCAIGGNDPACEAAKSAQNSAYAANKAECELVNLRRGLNVRPRRRPSDPPSPNPAGAPPQ